MASSSQSIVEPSREEEEAMQTLADISTWAGIPGDLLYAPSMAGSLLIGLAGSGQLEYPEFGSLLISDVEQFITGPDWRYSARISAPIQPGADAIDMEEDVSAEPTTRPNPVARMRVRKAHNAARIKAGLVLSRL